MMRLTFTIAVALLCSMAAAESGRWAVKTDSSLPPTDASVIQNRWTRRKYCGQSFYSFS